MTILGLSKLQSNIMYTLRKIMNYNFHKQQEKHAVDELSRFRKPGM